MKNIKRSYLFVKVIENGSYSKASKHLKIPLSTLSREISALEKDLEQPLLYRNTRQLRTTECGAHFYQVWSKIIKDIDLAQATFKKDRDQEPHGLLRLAAPSLIGDYLGTQLIRHYLPLFPKLKIDVSITDKETDLIKEGFDVVIKEGMLPNSIYKTRRLAESNVCLFASPLYLKEKGVPKTINELKKHSIIAHNSLNIKGPLKFVSKNKTEAVNLNIGVRANSLGITIDAVSSGMGIALMTPQMCKNLMHIGVVAPVLPEWKLTPVPFNLVLPPHSEQSSKVKSFIDFLLANKEVLGLN